MGLSRRHCVWRTCLSAVHFSLLQINFESQKRNLISTLYHNNPISKINAVNNLSREMKNHILTCKTDKENSTIILNKEDCLKNKEFVPLPSDSTSKFQYKVAQALKESPTKIPSSEIFSSKN